MTLSSDLWVRLTFGQMDPLEATSCGQVCYYFSQVDLWSDISPPGETSCGQVCSYFSQVDVWLMYPPLGEALVWLDIFVKSSGQTDLWSDGPLTRDFILVAKCVTTVLRLTSGQTYPQGRDILLPSVLLLQSG